MFTYICMLAAFSLLCVSSKDKLVVSFIVFLEFSLHKTVYVFGVQITDYLNSEWLFVTYMLIESAAIYALYKIKSSLLIAILIFFNLSYNFYIVLQHTNAVVIDYSNYINVVQIIMIFELLFLAGVSKYANNLRNRVGRLGFTIGNRFYLIWRRICNGALL